MSGEVSFAASALSMTRDGPTVTIGGHQWAVTALADGGLRLRCEGHALTMTPDGAVTHACRDLRDAEPLRAAMRALDGGQSR